MIETCRKCQDIFYLSGKGNATVPAEYIVWGKFFDDEDLGPRCALHLPKHVQGRIDQYAIFDLRPFVRVEPFKSGDIVMINTEVGANNAKCLGRRNLFILDEPYHVIANANSWRAQWVDTKGWEGECFLIESHIVHVVPDTDD